MGGKSPRRTGRQGSRTRSRPCLGNDDPKASVVGEIIPGKEFYDYEAKYLSEGSVPVIPAKLTRGRGEADSRDGGCGVSGLRPLRAGAGRLSDGAGRQARIFLNEVNTCPVSPRSACTPSCGRLPASSTGPDHAAHRAGPRTPRGQEPDHLQPRVREKQGKRETAKQRGSETAKQRQVPEKKQIESM